MNEPVSLFDLGMLRTQRQLDRLARNAEKLALASSPGGTHGVNISISYDWGANRIVISGNLAGEHHVDTANRAQQLKSICTIFFRSIRQEALIELETGTPWFEHSAFSNNFSHIGYNLKNTPENHHERLDKIFEIRFLYPVRNKAFDPWTCHAPLLDTGFSIKEEAIY